MHSNPAASCSRRVRLQSTDALVALGNFIAIEVKCSFGNKFSSRVKLETSLRRRRRDCCSDCIFWSLVQFSLSLKVKLFVSIFRLACLLPQFVSAPCDPHLLGICHCDLLRTESGTTKNMGVSQVGAQPESFRADEVRGLRLKPKISFSKTAGVAISDEISPQRTLKLCRRALFNDCHTS